MNKIQSKKPRKFDYDLIIIGSGASGGIGAHLAILEGKKVGLVEMHTLGGNSLNFGCIPTKALLKSAETLETVQLAHRFGIRSSAVSFNYKSIQLWKDKALIGTGVKNESSIFRSEGIHIIRGKAHFLDKYTIGVGVNRITAKKFLIATGSDHRVPNIPGINETGFITYKEAGNLLKPPKSLFIIGGSALAYEYAQIFSAFGSRVHIAEVNDHLLPNEDPEVGDSAQSSLNLRGVRVHTSAKVIHLSGGVGRKVVTFEQNGQQNRVVTEELMITTKRHPNIDIGLENTGIKYSPEGIHVNKFMQTSNKNIFAAGSVVGNNDSIHADIQESRVAIHNLYNRKKIAMELHAIPRCVFGEPEIACVGLTEKIMKLTGQIYQTSIAPIGILGKASTSDYSAGFVKIIANHYGVLVGASIVAPHASEMLQELTFAIGHRHHACAVANTIHPFPTFSEAIRVAASKIKCI